MILAALLAALEDRDGVDDALTMEALQGFCNVLANVKYDDIAQYLLGIVMSLRALFDKVCVEGARRCTSTGFKDCFCI